MWGANLKRRLRRRRVAKWVATGLLTLVLVGWAVSINYSVGYANKSLGTGVSIANGGLYIKYVLESPPAYVPISPFATTRFHVNKSQGAWSWSLSRPFIIKTNKFSITIMVSFWLIVFVGFAGTALLWRWDDTPMPPGHCQSCGYNLTGNVSGVCPECGEHI